LTFREKASNGRRSVVRETMHSAISGGPSGAGYLFGLVAEPGIQYINQSSHYGRVFNINGSPNLTKDYRLGGIIRGMRAPCQIQGSGVVANYSNTQRGLMMPAAVPGVNEYVNRWGSKRVFSNGATDGQVRDSVCLSIAPQSATQQVGNILVLDSEFECLGAGINTYQGAYTGVFTPRITVARCLFRPDPNTRGLNIAVDIGGPSTNAPGLVPASGE
jgi:hypothetical protein